MIFWNFHLQLSGTNFGYILSNPMMYENTVTEVKLLVIETWGHWITLCIQRERMPYIERSLGDFFLKSSLKLHNPLELSFDVFYPNWNLLTQLYHEEDTESIKVQFVIEVGRLIFPNSTCKNLCKRQLIIKNPTIKIVIKISRTKFERGKLSSNILRQFAALHCRWFHYDYYYYVADVTI